MIIIQLFNQGNIYPNLNNVMANWAIPQERDSIMCIVQAGPSVGSLFAMVVSGYLGHYFDWPSIFYASGSLGVIWGIIHATVGKEGPESCTYLTEDERNYMKQSFRAEDKEVQEKKAEVPWRQILTSGPVIAITITSWCSTWASKTITTLIPSYVNGVLGFNLGHNGLISALPYLFAFPTNAAFALTARILKAKAKVPESFLRPFWNSLAMYGNAAALLTLAFVPVTQTLAIGLLVISTSVNVAIFLGHIINNLDLSPNFAGVIMSITNTTANTAAILGPLISTYLIKDDRNVYQWRIVFILSAVIAIIGNTVFIFGGTVKKQPWDEGKKPTSQPA